MKIFLLSEKYDIHAQFKELGIRAHNITIEKLLRIPNADLIVIVGFEGVITELISSIKQKFINTFVVFIYSDLDFISSTILSGANDSFYLNYINKDSLNTKIKMWMDAAKYKKLGYEKDFNGKNAFGAKVWPIRTNIQIIDDNTLTYLYKYLEGYEKLNEIPNFDQWYTLCQEICRLMLHEHYFTAALKMFFEENDELVFVTISGLLKTNIESYDKLIASLNIDSLKSVSFVYKPSKGLLSFYMRKKQNSKLIDTNNPLLQQDELQDPQLNFILRKSITNKLDSAQDYINEAQVTQDDISEFECIELEVGLLLNQATNLSEQLTIFAGFFEAYSKALQKFVEFQQLQVGISEAAKIVLALIDKDKNTQEQAIMFANFMMLDLNLWRTHVFILQDVSNIHYMDAALLANCMQFATLLNVNQSSSHSTEEIEFF